jgi:hypothetical protein
MHIYPPSPIMKSRLRLVVYITPSELKAGKKKAKELGLRSPHQVAAMAFRKLLVQEATR